MGRLDRLPARGIGGSLRLHVAATPLSRLIGLALSDPPPSDRALLIPGCRSVHTFGMRFAIDVLFLDEHREVIGERRNLRPWRVARQRGARAVLEFPSSYAEEPTRPASL